MTRPPDVDPEEIRKVMSRVPRPTTAQAAEIIAAKLGKPVSASLIAAAIRRHPEWELGRRPVGGAALPALDYACERALGPVLDEHKTSFHWTMLTAYERVQAGRLDRDRKLAKDALRYVAHRLRYGRVTDYCQVTGFTVRPGLPWEREAGAYFKIPPPHYARQELEIALRDPDLTEETRAHWELKLRTYRAAVDVLAPRGRG